MAQFGGGFTLNGKRSTVNRAKELQKKLQISPLTPIFTVLTSVHENLTSLGYWISYINVLN